MSWLSRTESRLDDRGVREGRSWLATFADRTDAYPPELAARVLFTYGSLVQTMGDYEASTALLEQSVAIYQRIDNARGHAYALHYLVRSSWGLRPRDDVRGMCERALQIFRDIEDPVGIGLSMLFVALDEYERGNYDDDLVIMSECDAMMRRVGAPHLVAHGPEIIARGLAAKGEDVAASAGFEEAIELYQKWRTGCARRTASRTSHCGSPSTT